MARNRMSSHSGMQDFGKDTAEYAEVYLLAPLP